MKPKSSKPKGQNMNKIKELLRDIFAPKIYVNKKYYGPKPFPEKEWGEVWKKHEEAFDLMDKLFKRYER